MILFVSDTRVSKRERESKRVKERESKRLRERETEREHERV